jgi:ATP adenylyltransferase
MRQLWAPWRLQYVQEAGAGDGCVFCQEATGELGDASLVVHRGDLAVILLNKFPYSSGHLMVAPRRHTGSLGDLDAAEAAEIHALTVHGIAALTETYAPDGFNVGWNLGAIAGGSIAAHLHQHVVPRWSGDTNFMPVLADVKVIPEHLESTRNRLIEAWG